MSLSTSSYKGTRDLYPDDMRVRNYVFRKWRQVVESFGYEEYDAPMLESLELYAAKSGQEIVNDQTYRFTDRGDREVAIRPEMTPSIARMVAARRQEVALPARLYSIGNFMRYERPQKGREREFWQLNFDVFGAEGIAADIETLSLSSAIVKTFGATDDMFTIRVNDRRLTDYVIREYLGMAGPDQMMQTVKLLDRREKLSSDEFSQQAKAIMDSDEFVTRLATLASLDSLDEIAARLSDQSVVEPLQTLIAALTARGITNIKFDPTLMRGFDYYTGIVFEIFDEAPENRRAMFGGGRYDGLVGLFGVEDLPVVGAAPGETMFIEFLTAHGLLPNLRPATQLIVLEIGGADSTDIVSTLRRRGLNVAVDFTDRKTDKKIKAAAKAGVSYALFVGNDELDSGQFPLKNLATGEQSDLDLEQVVVRVAA
ncbi:MAG: histidine--tRNA ligase [Sphaerimonospora mesophila]